MRLIVIGSDRDFFDEKSAVRARVLEQAELVSEMHVVVFTPKKEQYKTIKIDWHLTIHPTSSVGKWAYLSDAYRIAKQILKQHASKEKWLVSTQDPFESGIVGFIVAKKFDLPFHLQLHTDPFNQAWKEERRMNKFRLFIARLLFTRANGIRVVSDRVSRSLMQLGISRAVITKVPIFVDVARFEHATASFDLHRSYPDFSKIILSIGRLQPEKNYHQLIRAFARVQKIHDDTLLLIVGSGPERERLLAIARSLEIEKSVLLLSWARDVASYYKTSDIYVQPSLYEGWGMAVIEAMASGTPVVMSDVGCAGEILINEKTGLVVPVGDEAALSSGLERLLVDQKLSKMLVLHAKEELKKLANKSETLILYKTSWEKAIQHKENAGKKKKLRQ